MAQSAPAAPRPGSNQLLMMFMFIAMMFILFIPEARMGLGFVMGVVLQPLIGFDGRFLVVTIFLAGAIPLTISTLLRHRMTNWVTQGRMAATNKALGKEMREAVAKRNQVKMKKLQEVRAEVMREFMPVQMAQFRTLPITMILFIAIFAWLSFFIASTPFAAVSVPWEANVSLGGGVGFFASWVLLYIVITMPISLVLSRVLKFISFRRKLVALGEG
ncbi:MAG: EMC3/TMCO1 family protein [Candidatus Thermoplasmatota archaeon]|nr:EMC3/TMCO1 family protein [Candidatus Thermoplasmatota archaeon]